MAGLHNPLLQIAREQILSTKYRPRGCAQSWSNFLLRKYLRVAIYSVLPLCTYCKGGEVWRHLRCVKVAHHFMYLVTWWRQMSEISFYFAWSIEFRSVLTMAPTILDPLNSNHVISELKKSNSFIWTIINKIQRRHGRQLMFKLIYSLVNL